jgi:hypothetical protein
VKARVLGALLALKLTRLLEVCIHILFAGANVNGPAGVVAPGEHILCCRFTQLYSSFDRIRSVALVICSPDVGKSVGAHLASWWHEPICLCRSHACFSVWLFRQ